MNLHNIHAIVSQLAFQNYQFFVGLMGDGFYLQVRFTTTDNHDGEAYLASGRKWYLSPYMTESEIVQTALKAVLTSVEHEAREQFTYKGKALFGPHLDVKTLLEIEDRTEHRAEMAA